jgi:hypothetical protein
MKSALVIIDYQPSQGPDRHVQSITSCWVSIDQPAACRPVIHPSSKEH